MKSRQEYFESRRALMFGALCCYCMCIFLLLLTLMMKSGFATVAVIISLLLLAGATCSLYAHRQKEFLFCPRCGSKNIVKTTLFDIPAQITCDCPDCGAKIDLDKRIDKD